MEGNGRDWLLAECFCSQANFVVPDSFQNVPENLKLLLHSAQQFPPALALSRQDLEKENDLSDITQESYANLLADRLKTHLKNQSSMNCVRAQAKEDCLIGYLFKGQYAWVIAYEPNRKELFWVTGDFFIYNDSVELFDISEEQLALLPERYIKRKQLPL